MAEHGRRLGCLMEVPHHGASVWIIEKILHRAMAARDENGVILVQPRCDDIRDTRWISQPGQAVAEFEIVLKFRLAATEEVGCSGMEIQLRRVAFGVGEGD